MKQYKDTLQYVLDNGTMRGDRTGKGRHSVFSPPDEIYDLSEGFPLCTLRTINPNAMIDELLWFIKGSNRVEDLKYKFFWEKWAPTPEDVKLYQEKFNNQSDEHDQRVGTIGNLYGASWRKAPAPKGNFLPARKAEDLPKDLLKRFNPHGYDGKEVVSVDGLIRFIDSEDESELKTILKEAVMKEYWSNFDQLNELIYKIKTTPYSSRLRVSAYLTDYMAFEEFTPQENVLDGRACLTACHTFFQCYVQTPDEADSEGKLDLKLTLTSSDVPVGRVYNIAQYALLLSMIAQVTGLKPGRLIVSTGDAHIYGDQFEAVNAILEREPKELPKLWLNPEVTDLFSFTHDDIHIGDYNPHPAITIPVAM